MKLTAVGLLLTASCVGAFTLKRATVSIGPNKIELGEMNTQQIRQLTIGSVADIVSVSADIDWHGSPRPHQIALVLAGADDSTLAKHIVPTVNDAGTVKTTIAAKSLPAALKAQSRIVLKLIVADYDAKDKNILKQLAELVPSPDFAATAKYTPQPKLGKKSEIHHIFRTDPATVGPFVPIVFLALAAALFGALWIAWVSLVGKNLLGTLKHTSSVQLLYNIVFLTSLLGVEYTFVRYYLGQLIFTTIFHALVLGLPTLYFGSRVLRCLHKNRELDRN